MSMSLLRFFVRKTQPDVDDYQPKNVRTIEKEIEVNRYPPFDRGFPIDPVDKIIQSQSYLIDKIKVAMGFSDSDFDKLVLPVIQNYAEYVHLLPATSKEHFKGAGGLFRLGLEVAFLSLQSASGIIFSGRENSDKRRVLQPKWCYATFVAGLCVELYRPITSLVVVDDEGNEWPQLLTPLVKWLHANQINRYYVRWNESINGIDAVQRQSNAAYLLNQIIPQHCLQYMNAEGGHVITAMTATITGAARPNTGNHLYDIVMRSYEKCVTNDIKSNPELYGKFTLGAHMEPHIIDAMRSLYAQGDWKVNQKGSRLWYSEDGLFCIWEPAAKDIRKFMKERKLTGIPESQETLAEILMNAGIIFPNRSGGPLWEIVLPGTGKLMASVRFADVSILMLAETDKPIKYSFIDGRSTEPEQSQPTPVTVTSENKEAPVASAEAATEPIIDSKAPVTEDKRETPTTEKQISNTKQPQQTPKEPAQDSGTQLVPNTGRSELFETLSEDSKLLIGALLDDYLEGSSDFPIFYCDDGFAISVDEFRSKGQSEIPVLKEIGNRANGKRWLVTKPGSSKQTITIKHRGQEIECFVLSASIAKGLGFIERGKK
ncbi:MobH family relaxase [Methylophilus sp. QUAN]|uniref:MobH family relaxase n=1 Tax=Methylophilus sp. QUAN TaxID=2781020 RepID=UPI00188E14C8|nr:MobH family relaxase [Methylophilus sp. QUAN]MBF4991136.1 TraI domain-containing protein [Methylophilus sp. QUAN]